jgi:pimeloyl-ACP methyl ester carboxylesterase
MSEDGVRYRLRRLALRAAIVLALALFALSASGYVDAFSVVARAADLPGPLRRVADLGTVDHVERAASVPAPGGPPMRVRIYAPVGTSRQTVLLVAGLHPAGIEEPRLIAFARELAKSRFSVVTPDIEGLTQLSITQAITDDIERVARWVALDRGLAPAGVIGLIGISFSGGLAMVAAGRPSLRDLVSYVLSIGGHGDLPRVLRYLSSGDVAERTASTDRDEAVEGIQPPHDYGVTVVVLNVAERLVPSDQVDGLRDLTRRFLWASSLEGDHESRAAQELASIREDAGKMPEPSATLLRHVIDRDVEQLGSQVRAHIGDFGNDPALSPSRSARPTAPVFLLHGREDNVIPAIESQYLADHLHGGPHVKLLVTDLLSHAKTDGPKRIVEVVKLIEFLRQVLAQSAPREPLIPSAQTSTTRTWRRASAPIRRITDGVAAVGLRRF